MSWFVVGLGCIQLFNWLKWVAWTAARGYVRSFVNGGSVFTPVTQTVEPRLTRGGGPITPSELKRRRDG